MQAETEGICDIPMENFDTTLIPVEFVQSEDILPRTRVSDPTSIVELGKQLLACAKSGDTDMVRDLMCRGAPFTTDWVTKLNVVIFIKISLKTHFIILFFF